MVPLEMEYNGKGDPMSERTGQQILLENLVNLTPHQIDVLAMGTGEIMSIPPSGSVARVDVERERLGWYGGGKEGNGGLEIFSSTYGEVAGLPDPRPNCFLIVSGIVAAAAAATGRSDVLSPGELVRDEDGRVIGCRGLSFPANT